MSVRGHEDRWDSELGCWVYADTGEPVDMSVPFGGATRPCDGCGGVPTAEGHDACIANLPGVRFACCGHRSPSVMPYVTLDDGTCLRSDAALAFFEESGRTVGLMPE